LGMTTWKAFRAVLAAVGALMIIDAAALVFTSTFNAGIVFFFLLGAAVLAAAWKADFLRRFKAPAWVFGAALFMILAGSLLLTVIGGRDTADYREDALIVLGSGVRGETPTGPLRRRLEAALEYHGKNPAALIVVSGGQGPQEDITEAEAMRRWLAGKGVPDELIIKEDRSRNTYENLEFSKAILDKRFGAGAYRTAFVTNAFHIFRAARLSRLLGLDARHVHAGMNPFEAPLAYLREFASLAKMWVLYR